MTKLIHTSTVPCRPFNHISRRLISEMSQIIRDSVDCWTYGHHDLERCLPKRFNHLLSIIECLTLMCRVPSQPPSDMTHISIRPGGLWPVNSTFICQTAEMMSHAPYYLTDGQLSITEEHCRVGRGCPAGQRCSAQIHPTRSMMCLIPCMYPINAPARAQGTAHIHTIVALGGSGRGGMGVSAGSWQCFPVETRSDN